MVRAAYAWRACCSLCSCLLASGAVNVAYSEDASLVNCRQLKTTRIRAALILWLVVESHHARHWLVLVVTVFTQ